MSSEIFTANAFSINPPTISDELNISFPAKHVLLLTFNRPKFHNAMTPQLEMDVKLTLNWFDREPSLWIVIVTGKGQSFCAGADLKAWNQNQQSNIITEQERVSSSINGFGSISRRRTSVKPMICAVNGGAYGGGVEMVLNCDIVVASQSAKFALPEVKRGVVAIQGAIPRLAKAVGHQFASEMLLTGKTISAVEARDRFHFVNYVVPASEVVSKALEIAELINANSPDSVQSTKQALVISQSRGHEETVQNHVWSHESWRVYNGDNIKEGLKGFLEKRNPVWKNPSKL